MTFHITVAETGGVRVVSEERLQPTHFRAIAAELRQTPIRARKIGYVAARQAHGRETVETRWNGTETTNTAEPGDWIVTNLSPQRQPLRDRDNSLNTYVIAADAFPNLYEPTGGHDEHGAIYRAKGVVEALPLSGGFDILAPWGERQQASTGFLILNLNAEVFGLHEATFASTYDAAPTGR